MSARDIIASCILGGSTFLHEDLLDMGDEALSALTSAGYRILAPGEMDRETLEAAAKVAADRARDWLVGQPLETRRDAPPDIAAAIRALGGAEG